MNQARALRRDRLFDYLVANPGVTIRDMERHLEASRSAMETSIRDLRLLLGDIDDINLVCEPDGQSQPWRYRLVGTIEGAEIWPTNRLLDTEQRLRTMEAVMRSLASGLDKRTVAYKKADLIESTVGYLNRELARLNGNLF